MINETINGQLVALEQELQKIKSAADYLDSLATVQQKNEQLLKTIQASYEETLRGFEQQTGEVHRSAQQLADGLLDEFGKQVAAGSKQLAVATEQFAAGGKQLSAGGDAVKQAAIDVTTQMNTTRQAYETYATKTFELHHTSMEQWEQRGKEIAALTDRCQAVLDGTETLHRALQSVNFAARLDDITHVVQDSLSEQRRHMETALLRQERTLNHIKWIGWGIVVGVVLVGGLIILF